jgi:heat shock protein HslJ
MTWHRVTVALGSILLATACASPAGPTTDTTQPTAAPTQPAETTQPSMDPTGIAWALETGTVDGAAMTVVDGHLITLTITGDEASGTAACNGYGATVTISGSEIEFDELAMTQMACTPDEVMDSELLYIEALPRVETYSANADSLTLNGEGVELNFVALPPVPIADLTGTVWVLDSLVQGDSVSSAAGERATLELYTDGSMLGSTGCRSLHGTYVVSGAEVQMPEMAAEGECPADLQAQDGQVVSVLGDGFRVAIDGQSLTVTSTGGFGLVYRAEG